MKMWSQPIWQYSPKCRVATSGLLSEHSKKGVLEKLGSKIETYHLHGERVYKIVFILQNSN